MIDRDHQYKHRRREYDGDYSHTRRTSMSVDPRTAYRIFLIACLFDLPFGTVVNAAIRHGAGGQPRMSLVVPEYRKGRTSGSRGVGAITLQLVMSEREDLILEEIVAELGIVGNARWSGTGIAAEACVLSLYAAIMRHTYAPLPYRERCRGAIPVLVSYKVALVPSLTAMRSLASVIENIRERPAKWITMAKNIDRIKPGCIPEAAFSAIKIWDSRVLRAEWQI